MHPKQICKDIESMGSKLVLDGDDLYIENPENIYPEIEDVVKGYKSRIITYLKGEYSNQLHAIKQTIDKMVDWQLFVEQDINKKINAWFLKDYDSLSKFMTLMDKFYKNGWDDFTQPIANYEDKETDKLSLELYERAMSFFKGG
jgi:hypothetical protein